jgi:hypothetical protein
MYPVAVVLQYIKKHKITHTHTQNNTRQNDKHNNTKLQTQHFNITKNLK